MRIEDIKIGCKYIYYPKKESPEDNRHFPAIVEKIGVRVRVRVFMAEFPQGVMRSVAPGSLSDQCELL